MKLSLYQVQHWEKIKWILFNVVKSRLIHALIYQSSKSLPNCYIAIERVTQCLDLGKPCQDHGLSWIIHETWLLCQDLARSWRDIHVTFQDLCKIYMSDICSILHVNLARFCIILARFARSKHWVSNAF